MGVRNVGVHKNLAAAPCKDSRPEVVAQKSERSSRPIEVGRASFGRPYVPAAMRVKQCLRGPCPNLAFSAARIHRGVVCQRFAIGLAQHVDVVERNEARACTR
jgi:hypothetical protein